MRQQLHAQSALDPVRAPLTHRTPHRLRWLRVLLQAPGRKTSTMISPHPRCPAIILLPSQRSLLSGSPSAIANNAPMRRVPSPCCARAASGHAAAAPPTNLMKSRRFMRYRKSREVHSITSYGSWRSQMRLRDVSVGRQCGHSLIVACPSQTRQSPTAPPMRPRSIRIVADAHCRSPARRPHARRRGFCRRAGT